MKVSKTSGCFAWIRRNLHNGKTESYEIIKAHFPRLLNCGVDVCDFYPVTLEEAIEWNERFYG